MMSKEPIRPISRACRVLARLLDYPSDEDARRWLPEMRGRPAHRAEAH